MARKKGNMLVALEQQAKGYASESTHTETTAPAKNYKHPSRTGKVNVTGYFPPSVKSSFRMIQIDHPNKTIQELLAEALNDLFAKYNVPQTARLDE